MDGASDDLNPTQWAAAIGILVLLAVPLAVGLAWWCKRRYARAVVALQRGSAPTTIAAPAPVAAPSPQAAAPTQPALRIDISAVTDSAKGEVPAGLTAGRRMRRRVLIAQVVLGTVYWWSLLLAAVVAGELTAGGSCQIPRRGAHPPRVLLDAPSRPASVGAPMARG